MLMYWIRNIRIYSRSIRMRAQNDNLIQNIVYFFIQNYSRRIE